MGAILKECVEWKEFELLINTKIFSQDIALDAAYGFLDKGYFFFDLNEDENLILQFTAKPGITQDPKEIIWGFSDELLNMTLRDKLEKDNKEIRETIVKKAINWPFDIQNFVSLDTDTKSQKEVQDDFDKDIGEILKDIENDPALQVNEEEIENILKEIEENNKQKIAQPAISVNADTIKAAKDTFKKWK